MTAVEARHPRAAGEAGRPRRTWWALARRIGLAVLLVAVAVAAGLIRPDLPAEALEARYATGASQFVDVDGLRVHVRDEGTGGGGPPIVLLHGANSSLHTWEGWVAELSGEHRIVTLDLPGHGLTGPDARERYGTGEMAALLDGLLSELGLERVVLGGNSMGGAVAWRYALEHPERVERLILVDAAGYPSEGGAPLVFRLARLPVVGEVLTLMTPDALFAANLRSAYGDPDAVTADLVRRYADLNRREGNRGATLTRLRAPEQAAPVDRLREIDMPVLVQWGGQDTWIPPESAERFGEDLPAATVVVYPRLGHVPMEEDPMGTAADVRRFLDG